MPSTTEALATTQDVIDALRLALSQKDPARVRPLVLALVELAPETDSNRGIQLLIDLIAEGSLTVDMADEDGRGV